MATITIIGGHGKVGLLLAPLLVDAGHQVTSVIRNPDHRDDVERTGATALVADVAASDTDAITELLADSDAVVWSAGAGGGSPERTYAVDRDAAIRSIDAAVAAEARRYVMVSYFGSGPDHGVDPSDDFFAYAESKAAADEHLRGADLDWTILAPSALTLDDPTGRIDPGADKGTSVSRADVAAVIAAALADPTTIGRTISFNSGDQPIAEAIRA
ncbi:SDR family oxidoreductase [Microbacterium sp. KSW-18]|uniref:SDR family oxidoreductase n=1 Tax=Microbacterium aquilitoris TaxID=3067307 RepID=A0ABU3GIW7_9MICO|nr:SDR family oxidoreductase [Microbacterium sp. KSW-18]MDT3330647.1 SDR family oxidoreductase [Microbacterium sp. KSW-18]